MSIPQLDNTPRCQHVRLRGKQCQAPARRGTKYCLFHEAEHVNEMKITFPPIEDAASVAVATDQVIGALKDDTIDYRRAGLLLSGLRLARINLRQLGLELGDEVEPGLAKAEGHRRKTKEEREDEELAKLPSLAETLLEGLHRMESEYAEERNEPAPEAVDVAAAKARGENLNELVLKRLDSMLGMEEDHEKISNF